MTKANGDGVNVVGVMVRDYCREGAFMGRMYTPAEASTLPHKTFINAMQSQFLFKFLKSCLVSERETMWITISGFIQTEYPPVTQPMPEDDISLKLKF